MKKKLHSGFSLVELLVVVTIIAILSVTAYVALGGQTIKARDSKRQQDLSTIQGALEVYFLENSRYPKVLEAGDEKAPDYKVPKKYLSTIPVDPNGEAYLYSLGPGGLTYEVGASLEKDGNLENFETYIIGNADPSLIKTAGGKGRYYKMVDQNQPRDLAACSDGKELTSGKIGDEDKDKECIPYDPR